MDIFSERLSNLFRIKGVKHSELAGALHISRQAVYSYMKKTIPPAEILVKIADFFEVSVDYLLGHEVGVPIEEKVLSACELTQLSENAVKSLGRYTEHSLNIKIMSDLIEKSYIQNFVSAICDSIIAEEQFGRLYESDRLREMEVMGEYRFQQLAIEIYKDAKKNIKQHYSEELKQETIKQKMRLINAAKEARTRLDTIIAEEKTQ